MKVIFTLMSWLKGEKTALWRARKETFLAKAQQGQRCWAGISLVCWRVCWLRKEHVVLTEGKGFRLALAAAKSPSSLEHGVPTEREPSRKSSLLPSPSHLAQGHHPVPHSQKTFLPCITITWQLEKKTTKEAPPSSVLKKKKKDFSAVIAQPVRLSGWPLT